MKTVGRQPVLIILGLTAIALLGALAIDWKAPGSWRGGLGATVSFATEVVGIALGLALVYLVIGRKEQAAEQERQAERKRIRDALLHRLERWRNWGWLEVAYAARVLDARFRSSSQQDYRELRGRWKEIVNILTRRIEHENGAPHRGSDLIRLSELGGRPGGFAVPGWYPGFTYLRDIIERTFRLYLPSIQVFPKVLEAAEEYLDINSQFSEQLRNLAAQAEQNERLLFENSRRDALEQLRNSAVQAEQNQRLLSEESRGGRLHQPIGPEDHWVLDPVPSIEMVGNYRERAKVALRLVVLCESEIGEWTPPMEMSESLTRLAFWGNPGCYSPPDYREKRLDVGLVW